MCATYFNRMKKREEKIYLYVILSLLEKLASRTDFLNSIKLESTTPVVLGVDGVIYQGEWGNTCPIQSTCLWIYREYLYFCT